MSPQQSLRLGTTLGVLITFLAFFTKLFENGWFYAAGIITAFIAIRLVWKGSL